ncbi:Rieske 2Fe-2S domain-containing protein [Cyclobacteriaceae bacterium]|jgi:cytochrome b6-f complex iron-sulfur subunit|nr:Rieske 2Fe-2S domain-containing protein [Cyclobacteriaceae bacterium]
MKKQEGINRKQFLSKLGLGTGAIMATYCLGSLISCDDDDDYIGGEVDFTLDLDESAYDALNAVGGYVRINKVVIAAVSEGTFVAVTQICSHQGAENVTFRSLNNDFYCTQHGAIFDLEGKGLNSNGSKGILVYKTSLSGTLLRIYS